ncbi:hypothetical protein C8R46DRAFT_432914 [Mycena filopes]|nr:hypothetical protein C8R46DRAFT_432914 [Mycena filopes]
MYAPSVSPSVHLAYLVLSSLWARIIPRLPAKREDEHHWGDQHGQNARSAQALSLAHAHRPHRHNGQGLRVSQLIYGPTTPAFLQSCIRDVPVTASDDPLRPRAAVPPGRKRSRKHGPARRLWHERRLPPKLHILRIHDQGRDTEVGALPIRTTAMRATHNYALMKRVMRSMPLSLPLLAWRPKQGTGAELAYHLPRANAYGSSTLAVGAAGLFYDESAGGRCTEGTYGRGVARVVRFLGQMCRCPWSLTSSGWSNLPRELPLL